MYSIYRDNNNFNYHNKSKTIISSHRKNDACQVMVTPEGIHTTQQSSNHQSNKRPKFSPPLSHKMKRSFKDCVSDDLSLGAEVLYIYNITRK